MYAPRTKPLTFHVLLLTPDGFVTELVGISPQVMPSMDWCSSMVESAELMPVSYAVNITLLPKTCKAGKEVVPETTLKFKVWVMGLGIMGENLKMWVF